MSSHHVVVPVTLSLFAMVGCAQPNQPAPNPGAKTATGSPKAGEPALELVESWPVETGLDHPDIPDAHEVWIEMIRGAQRTLDIEEFYASTAPDSRLENVLEAVEEAAARGVRVRSLFGKKLYDQSYPRVPHRLAALPGAAMRIIDMSELSGGVQHAKFFVVDGREAYLGSQNLDWRSLTHIQELGLRIRQPELVAAVVALFELDWQLADAGREALDRARPDWHALAGRFPIEVDYRGETVAIEPGMSPRSLLPDESMWDLDRLTAMIDSARDKVRVQLLSYSLYNHDGTRFTALDRALRRAAARGVEIELLLSDWNKAPGNIDALKDLQRDAHITVKLVTIPEHSGGFIPFARVIHSKYMTVDGIRSWIGSSNWSGSYFYQSRNIGLFFRGRSITADLDRFFATVWAGEYAEEVDPAASYEPPRIAE